MHLGVQLRAQRLRRDGDRLPVELERQDHRPRGERAQVLRELAKAFASGVDRQLELSALGDVIRFLERHGILDFELKVASHPFHQGERDHAWRVVEDIVLHDVRIPFADFLVLEGNVSVHVDARVWDTKATELK